MTDAAQIIQNLLGELRRGTIIIGVLSQLKAPQYGYSLVTILEEQGMNIDPGTLYPLLRRLEKQLLLESSWDTNEARPRKYYVLTDLGRGVYEGLCREWKQLNVTMEKIMNRGG